MRTAEDKWKALRSALNQDLRPLYENRDLVPEGTALRATWDQQIATLESTLRTMDIFDGYQEHDLAEDNAAGDELADIFQNDING